MNDRRLGKFTISKEEIANYPETVKCVMREVIIVRAEYMYDGDCIEYTAISDQFLPTRLGEYTPTYEITIDGDRAIFTRRY
jgi:ribosomal protein S19